MNGPSKSIRALAVLGAALAAWQSASAQPPSAAFASARRVGDHWQVSPPSPAGGAGALRIDGKPVPRPPGEGYSLPRLARGLHTVEIGGPAPHRLMVRESGAKSLDPAPGVQVFRLVVDKLDPRRPAPTYRVKQGDLVQLDWSSAKPVLVHLHGYDIMGNVGPAAPLSMVFDANLAGRFPAETHEKVHSAVAFIEVYPR